MKQRILRFPKPNTLLHFWERCSIGFLFYVIFLSFMTLPVMGQITITQTPTPICNNREIQGFNVVDVIVTLEASGKPNSTYTDGGKYRWYQVNTEGYQIFEGSKLNVNNIFGATTYNQTFYVEYIDQNGKVSPRVSHEIAFQAGYARISQGQVAAFCGRKELILQADLIAGASYQWQRAGSSGTGSALQPQPATPGLPENQFRVTETGTYGVTVTSAGCMVASLTIEVTSEMRKPVIKTSDKGIVRFCAGDNLVLRLDDKPAGDYKYRWQRKDISSGTVEWLSTAANRSENSFYVVPDEDKNDAGKYEYRVAVTTFTKDASNNDVIVCEDILSEPVVLEKTELPKPELNQEVFPSDNTQFTTISTCPETDELGNPIGSGFITVDAKIERRDNLKYTLYRSLTPKGAGVAFASITVPDFDAPSVSVRFTIDKTGYYYIDLSDESCQSEPSKRIMVNTLDYEPPFITSESQAIDKNTPIVYVCEKNNPVSISANFDVPVGLNKKDFRFFWVKRSGGGAGKGGGGGTFTTVKGGSEDFFALDINDLSDTGDDIYQVLMQHKNCSPTSFVRSKTITVRKLSLKITGEHKKSNGTNAVFEGNHQSIQLCPSDTYTTNTIASAGLSNFFAGAVPITWTGQLISSVNPDPSTFFATSAPSGNSPGNFRASVSVPGLCEIEAFITIRAKTAEASSSGEFCKGEKAKLAFKESFLSYSWRRWNATSKAFDNEVSTAAIYETDEEGLVIALLRDAECEFFSDVIEVKQATPPTILASVKGIEIEDKVYYCNNANLPTINIGLNPKPDKNIEVKYTWTKYDKSNNFITIKAFEVSTGDLEVAEYITANEPAIYVLDVYTGGCDITRQFMVDRIDLIDFVSTLPSNPSGQTLCPKGYTTLKGGYEYVSDDFSFQWEKQTSDTPTEQWNPISSPVVSDKGRKVLLNSTDEGVYRLRVTGCTPQITGTSNELTFLVPPTPITPASINGDINITELTYCGEDGVVPLSVSLGTGYTVEWYQKSLPEDILVSKAAFILISGTNAIDTDPLTITNGQSAVFYAKVKYNNVCEETTQEVTVKRSDTDVKDRLRMTPSNTVFGCGSVVLSTNFSTASIASNYDFTWEEVLSPGNTSSLGSTPTVNIGDTPGAGNTDRVFSVTVTPKSGGIVCQGTASVTIKATNPTQLVIKPKTTKNPTNYTACPTLELGARLISQATGGGAGKGGSSVTSAFIIDGNTIPAKNYTWTTPRKEKFVGQTIPADTVGLYSLELIGLDGCVYTDQINIVSGAAKPIFSSDVLRLCKNGQATLRVLNYQLSGKYTWYKKNSAGIFQVVPLGEKGEAIITSEGTYKVAHTVPPECGGGTQESNEVEVKPAKNVTIELALPEPNLNYVTEICETNIPAEVVVSITEESEETLLKDEPSTNWTYLWEKQDKDGQWHPAPLATRVSKAYIFNKSEVQAGGTNEAKYRLKVTQHSCSFYSKELTVKVVPAYSPDAKLTITSKNPELCATEKAVLTASNYPSEIGLVWSSKGGGAGKGGGSAVWTALASKNTDVVEVGAGTYRVEYKSSCGNLVSDEIVVKEPVITKVEIEQATGATLKYCDKQLLSVKNSASFPSSTAFKWTYSDGVNPKTTLGTGVSYLLGASNTNGTYSIEAQVGAKCILTTSVNVEKIDEYEKPLKFIQNTYTLCKDGTVDITVKSPSGAPNYEWRYAVGSPKSFDTSTPFTDAQNKNTYTFKPKDVNKELIHYIIVKASSASCGEVEGTVAVHPFQDTKGYKITQDNGLGLEFCSGSTFELTQGSTMKLGYQYIWLKATDATATTFATAINSSSEPYKLISDIPGIYKVQVAPSGSCEPVETDTVKVTALNTLPSGNETLADAVKFCSNQDLTTLKYPGLVSSSIVDYAWFRSDNKTKTGTYASVGTGDTYTIQLDKTKNITDEIDAKSGWYRLDVTHNCQGVTTKKGYFMKVDIGLPPSASVVELQAGGVLGYCNQTSNPHQPLSLKNSVSGSIQYQWYLSMDNKTYAPINSSEGRQSSYNALDLDGNDRVGEGTYYRLRATDDAGCFVESDPVLVYEYGTGNVPKYELDQSGNVALCTDSNGNKSFRLQLAKAPNPSDTYEWVKRNTDGSLDVLPTIPSQPNYEYTITEIGQYFVRVKNDCSLNKFTSSNVVEVKDPLGQAGVIKIAEAVNGSEYAYCQTQTPGPSAILNIANPSTNFEYRWIKKGKNDSHFTTVISANGITVSVPKSDGNVPLEFSSKFNEEGTAFAVMRRLPQCEFTDKERSESIIMKPVTDISKEPKRYIQTQNTTNSTQTVFQLCGADEKITMLIVYPGGYDYKWQKQNVTSGVYEDIPNATSSNFTTSGQGFYKGVIMSSCGDLETHVVEVKNPKASQPSIAFQQSNPTFCNQATVKEVKLSLDLVRIPTGTPFIWEHSLDNGISFNKIAISGSIYQNATKGLYRVTATVDGCELDPIFTTVTGVDSSPEPEIVEEGAVYFCGEDSAQITLANIASGDSVQWLFSTGAEGTFAAIDSANNQELRTNVPGFYQVRVISEGCGFGDSERIIEVIGTDEKPLAIVEQGTSAQYCPGGDVILSVKQQELYEYRWYFSETPDGEYKQASGVFGITNYYPASQEGYYKVLVYFNGCAEFSDSVHVTESPDGIPIPEVEGGLRQGVCYGETFNLSTTTRGTGYYYFWSYSETENGTFVDISPNTPEYEISLPGFYRILVGKEGCGEQTQTLEIYQIANRPLARILQDPFIRICKDNPTLLEVETTHPNYTYEWRRYDNSEDLTRFDVIGIDSVLETNLAGVHRVFVANQGCGTLSNPVSVIRQKELSNPRIVQGERTGFCPGEQALLEVKEKSRFTTFTWFYAETRNGNYTPIHTGLGEDFDFYLTNNAGFYKLQVEQPNCAPKESGITEVVGVNEPPVAIINDGQSNIEACIGEVVTLSAQSATGVTYQWDGPEGFVAEGREVDIQVLTSTNAGRYTLTSTILGNCSNTAQINLQVNQLPQYTVVPPNIICTGDATGMIEIQSDDPNLTYKFGENGTYSEQKIFDELTAGNYQVSITTPAGCEVTENIQVQESDQLGVTLTAQDVTVNKGERVQLSVSGARNYLWKPENPDEFLSELTDPNPWVAPLETRTYIVKGNSPEGCGVTQVNVTVQINYDIKPNNIITPNNDDVNDTWQVNMKYAYPNATIRIFDRWGLEVYSFTGSYEDDWAGTDQSGATLPTGAYSYIIEPNFTGDAELNKPIVGVITIVNE